MPGTITESAREAMALTAILLPSLISSPSPSLNRGRTYRCGCSYSPSSSHYRLKPKPRTVAPLTCRSSRMNETEAKSNSEDVECIGTGSGAECRTSDDSPVQALNVETGAKYDSDLRRGIVDWIVLISPFFFWGTAMVAMKEVIPKAGPFFVSTFRLIPAGFLLIGFAGITGRKQPSGILAWVSILLFGIVDAACFQVGCCVFLFFLF